MSESDKPVAGRNFNLARYFVEHRQVAWVLLITVLLGGVLGYLRMPKRKDPEIQVRIAVAAVAWPGARAELVEEAVTRRLEAKIGENTHIDKIESTTRTGGCVIKFTLTPDVEDTGKEFDDIAARINTLQNWPKGAYPPVFMKDFGDTVALMLTVSSPPMPEVETRLRGRAIQQAITAHRSSTQKPQGKDVIFAFPASVESQRLRPVVERIALLLAHDGSVKNAEVWAASGLLALDVESDLNQEQLGERVVAAMTSVIPEGERHPDLYQPFVAENVQSVAQAFARSVGPRYSFRELDDFTEKLQRRLQRVPLVSKVTRVGLRPEQFTLDYSQEKLGQAGIGLDVVAMALGSQNVNLPGGTVDVQGRSVAIRTSGELQDTNDINNVLLTTTAAGAPIRLADLFDVQREYQNPRLLNSYSWSDSSGQFRSSRAITLAISMRSGAQIADFGKAVDAGLQDARGLLPEDLVIARTSDQPQQVEENVSLFTNSLIEAIILVVVVALVGFLSWRTATILALSIPITLAMTYGMMNLIGWDIQQISISTMILALGLLVDVPVVASDAIVAGLAQGESRREASWRGPTRLSVAILFATVTNVVAYLPFLAVPGDIGRFIKSLPVVMTIALLAAWLLSLTVVPMLGATLLSAPKRLAPSLAERRQRGFGRVYATVATWSIRHRGWVLLGAVCATLVSYPFISKLKVAFFPKDLSYLSYVDVWLPEDATISSTRHTAEAATAVIEQTLREYGKAHPDEKGQPRQILKSVTSFVGGGGPRFWFSVTPEQQQPNYAQLVVQVNDKHDTNHIVDPIQRALVQIPGARIDVRQLETAKPVGIPVQMRITGENPQTLRDLAERTRRIFAEVPFAERIRDDWGSDALTMDVLVDAERAALAGISHYDVATASAASNGGQVIGAVRDSDTTIPVVARLRQTERVGLSNLSNLYVASARSAGRVPLGQVASTQLGMVLEKIQRRNHERTITVAAFPGEGRLASEVMQAARPALDRLRTELPPGYSMEVGGEEEELVKGFGNLVVVLIISVLAIFIALTVQFKSAAKPLIVFTTIPLGVVGALVSLRLTNSPFGFMAFLGIISLIGVIVSHVIVLFDFIEERREHGDTLEDALISAGIQRLRPVLITVVATVIALFPLAAHGGPLWEPLCYAQIGGLSIATFVTLLIVPVTYAVFIKDLKILKWKQE
jgi:multidrug efflux pump subunit AcrB